MAKRKTSLPAPLVHETAHEVIKDYGIYHEQAFKVEAFKDPEFTKKLKEDMRQKLANYIPRSARDKIKALRERMQSIAQIYAVPKDMGEEAYEAYKAARFIPGCELHFAIQVDLGKGRAFYTFIAPRTVGIEQVASVLNLIDIELGPDPTEREAKLFLAGLTAGRCV